MIKILSVLNGTQTWFIGFCQPFYNPDLDPSNTDTKEGTWVSIRKNRPMDQLQKSPCKTVRLGCFSSPHRLLVLSVMLFASCALGWLMVLYFSLPLACEREITHTTKTSSSIINNKLTHAKTARNVAPK